VLEVNSRIRIPLRELDIEFVRSSGPGGQNVNKVNTKAVMRWSVMRSQSLPPDVRERLLERYPRRISRDGELVLQSQRFRDQARNVADCLMKLRAILLEVATAPRPRRATRPGRRVVERRLADKRRRSEKKRQRSRPARDD